MAKKSKKDDDSLLGEGFRDDFGDDPTPAPPPPPLPKASPPKPAPAPKAAPPEPPTAPTSLPDAPRRYRIGRTSHYVKDGSVHTLHAGTVIEETQFDIAAMKAQDVPLEEMP